MPSIASLTFNPFQENTYILYDETLECVILDPGCYTQAERDELKQFIEAKNLKPVKLVNTHCHIDHVFGNAFVAKEWNLKLEAHKLEIPLLEKVPQIGEMYGVPAEESPAISTFLDEGDMLKFGNSSFEIIFTPGHSPGSLSFYHEKEKFVISGDVLFYQSIGRYDFPNSNYEDLVHSIKGKLFKLPDDVTVFSGHGPETQIGFEKVNNPFVGEHAVSH